MLEFTASSPVEVNRYLKDVLRCNSCGTEFMSNKQIYKWTNSARSSVILQKTSGMPFYRLSQLQSLYNAPVAVSTLWQQCSGFWQDCGSDICSALFMAIAKSDKISADDTKVRILEVIQCNKALPEKERRACNTTVIVAQIEGDREVVLYVSANRHCGENLGKILKGRPNKEDHVKLMVDASSQNNPVMEEVVALTVSNCLTHARRKFHELRDYYQECDFFLKEIAYIYKNDEICLNKTPKDRLLYHVEHSLPHLNNIYNEIDYLFREKLIEPNSSLGKAMNYWIRHKRKLMRFVQVEGVDIDNSKSERALKTIILQRKNSLFFKSLSSAEVLSGISSIVKTCAVNKINAFGYLNWVQENWQAVQKSPENFLPWHYGLSPPAANVATKDIEISHAS